MARLTMSPLGWVKLFVAVLFLIVQLAGCGETTQVVRELDTRSTRSWQLEKQDSPTDWSLWMDLQGGG